MRIFAIRGQNLASLADPFELDLESREIAQSGLFAITGAVGAGKSTLLDALCLALFDRTPRLAERGGALVGAEGDPHKIPASDVRGILRRGAGSGFAEVEFRGRSGRRMRSRWELRRARDRADGRLQKQTMSLFDMDAGRQLGGSKTETLEAIQTELGLTFEQFRRSVVLAQGEFAAFLQADARDRAALLERMTDTAIYGELSMAAHRRAHEVRKRIDGLQQERVRVEVLDPDGRRELDASIARVEIELRELDVAVTELERLERCERQRAANAAAISGLRARVDELSATESNAELAAGRAKDSLRACDADRAALQPELDAARTVDQAIERLVEQRDTAVARVGDLGAALESGAKALRRRRPDEVSDREAWRDFARELDRLIGIGRESAEAQRRLDSAILARERATEAAASAVAHRDACREALDRVQQSVDGLPSHDARAELRGCRDAAELRLEAIDALLAEARVAARRGEVEAERARLARELQASERAERQGQRDVDEALRVVAEVERERRRADLSALRPALVDGEPCPLCGAEEHPFAVAGPELARDLEARVADADRARALAVEALGAVRGQARSQRTRLAEIDSQLESSPARASAEESAANRARLADLEPPEQATVAWCESTRVRLRRERDRARDAEKVLHDRLDEADRLRQELERLRAVFADAVGAVGESERDARERDARIHGFERSRNELREREGDAHHALEEMLAQRRAEWTREQAVVVALEADLDRARSERAALLDGKPVADVESAHAARRAAAERNVETRRDEWTAAVRDAAAARSELTAAERQLAELVSEHAAAASRFAEAATRAGIEPDGGANAVRERREQVTVEREGLTITRGVDDDARKRITWLEQEIDAERRRSAPRLAVAELIGSADGRKFRSFAQGLSFEHLLAHANRHLDELARRYRLMAVPGEDLDLQVVDCEMGQEVRSIHSLSGGETFLVSLALALGLASMAAANLRFETLFIDEGLGTLDPDALETVLAALDALQANGYQVGVISHVEGLAERVGARVHVEKRGGGRSVVRVLGVSVPDGLAVPAE